MGSSSGKVMGENLIFTGKANRIFEYLDHQEGGGSPAGPSIDTGKEELI